MKKLLVFAAILATFTSYSFAQIPSKHAAVPVAHARPQAHHLQECCQIHPSSFVIRAHSADGTGIGDYLTHTYCTPGNRFLHIYIGEKELGKNETQQVLVITGAGYTTDYNTGRKHLANDWQHSPVWITQANEPAGCIPFDSDFDLYDEYDGDQPDLEHIGAGVVSRAVASAAIKAFQVNDCNHASGKQRTLETESFIINADDVQNYLHRNPHVQYLQFYLGYKPLAYETTIFIAGLDSRGRHVWSYGDNGIPYLFGHAANCPNCSIDFDESLDFHQQDARMFRQEARQ